MRLNQVTVGATDLGQAERFYGLLGLGLIVKTEHYLRFECPEGDSTFSVELVESVPEGEQVAIYFESDRLDEECARLRAAGVVFDSMPADKSWLWREAWLRDPDGHRVCLFYAGENRLEPPWRIRG
ncbi:VOC family protein [Nocardia sp. CDC160]|uniref:VOC family protein n=1 Tax=Nocardia sp. CDC160 TaxID=3112166 RepID=UPI002DB8F29E|nr:VOC family protein [Nocardia sp. CDC160]MEC3918720.1 VOC family protein [Nocardia sp. CDC160]